MEPNTTLARQWFEEVWNQRKTDLVHQLVLPDSVWHTEQGDLLGPQPFLAFHAQILRAMPDLRATIEGMISEGDHQGGKMVEGFDCFNVDGLMRQLAGAS
jgi:hypothetical protein